MNRHLNGSVRTEFKRHIESEVAEAIKMGTLYCTSHNGLVCIQDKTPARGRWRSGEFSVRGLNNSCANQRLLRILKRAAGRMGKYFYISVSI